MIGAVLFIWLQGAEFYKDLHKQAVNSLPLGKGKTWIDLGCGPGLVARQATTNYYDVTGIDTDASMVTAARLISKWHGIKTHFEVGDLSYLLNKKADVISAASLLAVLDDKESALDLLWESVFPKGYLLIIEPTDLMNLENANRVIKSSLPTKRINGLRMWAKARENRAVEPSLFKNIVAKEKISIELLDGLVRAQIFRKD